VIVSFKQIVPVGHAIRRAPRDGLGLIPVRAARYCEALTTACAYGWHVYPLLGFAVWYDGVDITWTYDGAAAWWELTSCQYPHFEGQFDEAAPDHVRGFSFPWLVRGQDHGILQIWTGLVARTAADWSLYMRAPSNIPHSFGYHHLDGIVETDRWGGGLFFNIRLLKTDGPIRFTVDRPYLQIQLAYRQHYDDEWLDRAANIEFGIDKLTAEDWERYHDTVVTPNRDPNRSLGRYAVAVRKRRNQDKARG
jgi:hypothetical protein